MYTLQDIINKIEIQSEFIVVIYDCDKEQRFQVDLNDKDIQEIKVQYMYVDDGALFIELNYYHFEMYCEENEINKNAKYLRKI